MTEGRRPSLRLVGWFALALAVIAVAAAWFVFDPGFRAGRENSGVAAGAPQDAFEGRVREFLLRNPEVIVEAMERLQERRRAAEQGDAEVVLKARTDEILRDPASPVGGNSAGDVTLVEFFDYNCPYCRRVAPVMVEAEAGDSGLRIVYKEFPILGPNSLHAARASLAAHRQGQYAAFHKALMQASGTVDPNAVLQVASSLGLDVTRLKIDMEDPAIQAAIERNHSLASALRITGTPSFVIGDQILRGATDLGTMQALIKQARAKR